MRMGQQVFHQGLEFGSARIKASVAGGGRTAYLGVAWKLGSQSLLENRKVLQSHAGFINYRLGPHNQNCLVHPHSLVGGGSLHSNPTRRSPCHQLTSQLGGTQNFLVEQ